MHGTIERLADAEVPFKEPLKIAVIIASMNRPQEVGQLLSALSRQTLAPSAIILSVTKLEDMPTVDDDTVKVIIGEKGLTRQRNRALDMVCDLADIAVFFDDDFLPTENAIAGIAQLFDEHPEVLGATGKVLRDGIKSGGLDYSDSVDFLEQYQRDHAGLPTEMSDFDELYGCNMAIRMSAAIDLRFDERLPLYAWQEDRDFAGQLLKRGRVVRTDAFVGVHRGVTKGRTPGVPLGISQIVNPVYLARKGTLRRLAAARLIVKNVLANHAKAFRPEAYVDRVGRVRGNWLGFWYVLTGRIEPEIILRWG
jgi:GT2 family glycosyltransferase